MSLQAVLIAMIVIFSGALALAVRNAVKYWKSKDGANLARSLLMTCCVSFICHYSRILMGYETIGYFSVIAGLCFLLIFVTDDLKTLLDKLK